jgi:hypothetical protein
MNVFAQAQVTQYYEDFHTSYGFPYYIIYNQQIYLNGARSGFEPELPIHIITLLSEMPVTRGEGGGVRYVEFIIRTVRNFSHRYA